MDSVVLIFTLYLDFILIHIHRRDVKTKKAGDIPQLFSIV